MHFHCSGSSEDLNGEGELSYLEFIELMGRLAYRLGDQHVRCSGRVTLYEVCNVANRCLRNTYSCTHTIVVTLQVLEAEDRALGGPKSSIAAPLSMLSRLHLLFFNMFRCGASFTGEAAGRLIRAVARKMKEDVEGVERAEKQIAVLTAAEQARRVQTMLAERLTI